MVTIHNKKQYYIKEIEENFTVAKLATDFFSQSPNPNSQSPLATIRSPMSSPGPGRVRSSHPTYPRSSRGLKRHTCSNHACLSHVLFFEFLFSNVSHHEGIDITCITFFYTLGSAWNRYASCRWYENVKKNIQLVLWVKIAHWNPGLLAFLYKKALS